MAGLMTTISNSLSLASDQAAFSVIVLANGPQSCKIKRLVLVPKLRGLKLCVCSQDACTLDSFL
jgi:hypothetical protein